jgi:hypothetical protein
MHLDKPLKALFTVENKDNNQETEIFFAMITLNKGSEY